MAAHTPMGGESLCCERWVRFIGPNLFYGDDVTLETDPETNPQFVGLICSNLLLLGLKCRIPVKHQPWPVRSVSPANHPPARPPAPLLPWPTTNITQLGPLLQIVHHTVGGSMSLNHGGDPSVSEAVPPRLESHYDGGRIGAGFLHIVSKKWRSLKDRKSKTGLTIWAHAVIYHSCKKKKMTVNSEL